MAIGLHKDLKECRAELSRMPQLSDDEFMTDNIVILLIRRIVEKDLLERIKNINEDIERL